MSIDGILRRVAVEGTAVRLERDGERLLLVAGAESVELSFDEATEVLNLGPDPFRELSLLGIDLGQQPSDVAPYLERPALLAQLPEDELLVLLDTTTLMGANLCLKGNVFPLGLLELSTLTFAMLCFDRIVVQPSPHADLPSMPSGLGAMLPLHYPTDFIPNTLWSLCASLHDGVMTHRDVGAYAEAWSTFLNSGDITIDLRAYDQYQDSPYEWDGTFAHAYAGGLFDAPLDGARAERNEFLSIQTMRTLFNDRLAGYLGVPYLASALRAPIQGLLLERKGERQLVADRLVAALGPAATTENRGPYASEVSAPFLLGLVLEQMQAPEDYWPIITKYRNDFAPLRKRLAQEREEWQGRPGAYLRTLLKPLGAAPVVSERAIDGLFVAAATVATATGGDVAAAGVGLKLARLVFPAEQIRRAYYKRFRPELHLLFSVSQEAKSLTAIEDRIAHIWGKSWHPAHRAMLIRLSSLQPPSFSRLRSLI